MDLERSNNYLTVSDAVRRFCTERLYDLEKALRPHVSGEYGDILPGHLSGYVATLKELARLWDPTRQPPSPEPMIPASKVAAKIAELEAQAQERLEAEVEAAKTRAALEAELAVRREIEAAQVQARMVDVAAARDRVLARAGELKVRIGQKH